MSAPNNKLNALHILVGIGTILGGSATIGTAITTGLAGLVLLHPVREWGLSNPAWHFETARAIAILSAMIGIAILWLFFGIMGLFFGVWLLKRGGTIIIVLSIVSSIVYPILFSIVACPFIAFLCMLILLSLGGIE